MKSVGVIGVIVLLAHAHPSAQARQLLTLARREGGEGALGDLAPGTCRDKVERVPADTSPARGGDLSGGASASIPQGLPLHPVRVHDSPGAVDRAIAGLGVEQLDPARRRVTAGARPRVREPGAESVLHSDEPRMVQRRVRPQLVKVERAARVDDPQVSAGEVRVLWRTAGSGDIDRAWPTVGRGS